LPHEARPETQDRGHSSHLEKVEISFVNGRKPRGAAPLPDPIKKSTPNLQTCAYNIIRIIISLPKGQFSLKIPIIEILCQLVLIILRIKKSTPN
jgi:hypothetical protein